MGRQLLPALACAKGEALLLALCLPPAHTFPHASHTCMRITLAVLLPPFFRRMATTEAPQLTARCGLQQDATRTRLPRQHRVGTAAARLLLCPALPYPPPPPRAPLCCVQAAAAAAAGPALLHRP